MQIEVNNFVFTSKHLMSIVAVVSLLTTIDLCYLKFSPDSQISLETIVLSLFLTVLNIHYIKK